MSEPDDEYNEDFQRLVDDHGRSVERLLMRLERDAQTREDLWSEVFTIAYARFDQLDGLPHDDARGWLLRTARYVNANSVRRAMTRSKVADRLGSDRPEYAPAAEDVYLEAASAATDDQRAMVEAAWSTLSGPHREVLAMDAVGYDGPAIARSLGISASAARSRLLRARRAFVQACRQPGGASR